MTRALLMLLSVGVEPLWHVPRLAVADLPPAPGLSATAPDDLCDWEVRGIVSGDTQFAVLQRGEQSILLHTGSGIPTRTGWVAVSGINAGEVTLRDRRGAHSCSLHASGESR